MSKKTLKQVLEATRRFMVGNAPVTVKDEPLGGAKVRLEIIPDNPTQTKQISDMLVAQGALLDDISTVDTVIVIAPANVDITQLPYLKPLTANESTNPKESTLKNKNSKREQAQTGEVANDETPDQLSSAEQGEVETGNGTVSEQTDSELLSDIPDPTDSEQDAPLPGETKDYTDPASKTAKGSETAPSQGGGDGTETREPKNGEPAPTRPGSFSQEQKKLVMSVEKLLRARDIGGAMRAVVNYEQTNLNGKSYSRLQTEAAFLKWLTHRAFGGVKSQPTPARPRIQTESVKDSTNRISRKLIESQNVTKTLIEAVRNKKFDEAVELATEFGTFFETAERMMSQSGLAVSKANREMKEALNVINRNTGGKFKNLTEAVRAIPKLVVKLEKLEKLNDSTKAEAGVQLKMLSEFRSSAKRQSDDLQASILALEEFRRRARMRVVSYVGDATGTSPAVAEAVKNLIATNPHLEHFRPELSQSVSVKEANFRATKYLKFMRNPDEARVRPVIAKTESRVQTGAGEGLLGKLPGWK